MEPADEQILKEGIVDYIGLSYYMSNAVKVDDVVEESGLDGYNLFGRNKDLSYSFNQAVTLLPRNYEYRDRVTGNMKKTKYASWRIILKVENKY